MQAHFVPVGQSSLELLEATAPESPIARFIEKRGPGLHHITLRVDDIRAALAQLKARGARLIDNEPRPGAEGALVAFIHPSSAQGVLIELKQAAARHQSPSAGQQSSIQRYSLGDLELISRQRRILPPRRRFDVRRDPEDDVVAEDAADDRNRIRLAMRPLIVRGARTMIIDAGMGDKENEKFHDIYGVERSRHLDHTLAEAGLAPEDIDIVLASHLHFDHAGGFTVRDASGRAAPALSARAVRRPARRVGGCDPPERANARQLPAG